MDVETPFQGFADFFQHHIPCPNEACRLGTDVPSMDRQDRFEVDRKGNFRAIYRCPIYPEVRITELPGGYLDSSLPAAALRYLNLLRDVSLTPADAIVGPIGLPYLGRLDQTLPERNRFRLFPKKKNVRIVLILLDPLLVVVVDRMDHQVYMLTGPNEHMLGPVVRALQNLLAWWKEHAGMWRFYSNIRPQVFKDGIPDPDWIDILLQVRLGVLGGGYPIRAFRGNRSRTLRTFMEHDVNHRCTNLVLDPFLGPASASVQVEEMHGDGTGARSVVVRLRAEGIQVVGDHPAAHENPVMVQGNLDAESGSESEQGDVGDAPSPGPSPPAVVPTRRSAFPIAPASPPRPPSPAPAPPTPAPAPPTPAPAPPTPTPAPPTPTPAAPTPRRTPTAAAPPPRRTPTPPRRTPTPPRRTPTPPRRAPVQSRLAFPTVPRPAPPSASPPSAPGLSDADIEDRRRRGLLPTAARPPPVPEPGPPPPPPPPAQPQPAAAGAPPPASPPRVRSNLMEVDTRNIRTDRRNRHEIRGTLVDDDLQILGMRDERGELIGTDIDAPKMKQAVQKDYGNKMYRVLLRMDLRPPVPSGWNITNFTEDEQRALMHPPRLVVETFQLMHADVAPFGQVYRWMRPEASHELVWTDAEHQLAEIFELKWTNGVSSRKSRTPVLEIRPSTLNDDRTNPPVRAGRGLFAFDSLPRGYRIPYDGVVIPKDFFTRYMLQPNNAAHRPRTSSGARALEIKEAHCFVDAEWTPDVIGAFPNHAPEHENAALVHDGFLVITRPVASEEEIFVDYGSCYGMPELGEMTAMERTVWTLQHPNHTGAPLTYRWEKCTVPECRCTAATEGLWTVAQWNKQWLESTGYGDEDIAGENLHRRLEIWRAQHRAEWGDWWTEKWKLTNAMEEWLDSMAFPNDIREIALGTLRIGAKRPRQRSRKNASAFVRAPRVQKKQKTPAPRR